MKSAVTKEKHEDYMDTSALRGGFVTSAMDFINCIICWASAAEFDCMTDSLRTARTKLILLILYLLCLQVKRLY